MTRLFNPAPDPATDQVRALLASGGDERIALDPATGRNRYGCAPFPAAGGAMFASCTASAPSEAGFAAACALHQALLGWGPPQIAYARGAQRVRARLASLCGLGPQAACDIILAPSGTDLHLIAADLARGASPGPLAVVLPDPRETGRGAPNALRGLAYATTSPDGRAQAPGEPLEDWPVGQLLTVPLREPDGRARDAEAVDLDLETACARAIAARGRALLVLLDVSKTGVLAGRRACAAALKARHGPALTILVDACQFRISPQQLQADLRAGFMVAVTGSKFLGGPAFCGALFAPPSEAGRLRRAPISPALAGWSARGDWPEPYLGRALLPDLPNLGLLLRWEAALAELEALAAVPPAVVRAVLDRVAAAVAGRLADTEAFEPISSGPLERPDAAPWDAAPWEAAPWDAAPSIFPFLVRRGGAVLDADQTQGLYLSLRDRADPVRLGQPVSVALREGRPVSALRLAIGAGQIVQASRTDPTGTALASEAVGALDRVAEAAAP